MDVTEMARNNQLIRDIIEPGFIKKYDQLMRDNPELVDACALITTGELTIMATDILSGNFSPEMLMRNLADLGRTFILLMIAYRERHPAKTLENWPMAPRTPDAELKGYMNSDRHWVDASGRDELDN